MSQLEHAHKKGVMGRFQLALVSKAPPDVNALVPDKGLEEEASSDSPSPHPKGAVRTH